MRSTVCTAAALAALALPLPAPAGTWAEVQAILQERCVFCHSGDAAPLGLVLESHAGLMAGSENGPVVVPGAPAESALIARLTGAAEPRMPLDGPPFLEPAQIAAVEAWIAAGAPGPPGGAAAAAAPPSAPADPMADGRVTYDEVAAIFGRHCIECHSENSKMEAPPEGLRLDSYASVLAGGDRLAVLPGNAQASEVIRRVEGLAEPRMPFDGPPWLTGAEIALLRAWIDGGALSAGGVPAPVPVGARLRIRGVMTGASEIDGAAFEITPATRIDDRPSVGSAAELRGRIGPDGRILAERLRDR
ncbi:MAG: hypothetical protein N2Z62_03705 [Rhodobacteraceae bacterium]|nr:hypothetical protein [Paracoccaceae bacterium]